MIKRNILNEIKKITEQFPITLITGPRQVGKSTLLYAGYKESIFNYVSLDDRAERNMAQNDPKGFLQLHPFPLIIDEVQYAPQLFGEITAIVNKKRLEHGQLAANGMFILTGSQSFKLMKNVQESMAGRVGIINMTCLSMNEVQGRDDKVFDINVETIVNRSQEFTINESNIYNYIIRGFFPALYEDPNMSTVKFYQSYVDTYLERDLLEIIDVKNHNKFFSFLQILASLTACELIYDTISNQVGVDSKTIKAWISALETSGLIYILLPYNELSISKRITRRPKVYFTDTGLASYLVGIHDSETLRKSFMKGRFVETYVLNEIRKSFTNNGLETLQFYFYRDNQQNEVDLVIIKNGKIQLIEMKSGTDFSLSDVKAFAKLDNSKFERGNSCIICTTDKVYSLCHGLYVIPMSSI